MRILLIDNYDSFTYNLVHYLEGEGCEVDVVRTNELSPHTFSNHERILISPGPKLPKDYPQLHTFLQQTIGKVPILGVCLGLQLLGEHLGGELYNLESVRHGVGHPITLVNKSVLFSGIPQEFKVGLYHSWAIRPGEKCDFDVTAIDQQNVVMAIENTVLNIYGVQFHPESILTEHGKKILANFIHFA